VGALALAAWAALAASPARAQLASDAAPRQWQHQVRADLGIASALGFAGVSYTWAAQPWLWVEGGLGSGLTGLQLSAMAKLARPVGPRAWLFAGLGPSVSRKDLSIADVGGAFHRVGVGGWVNVDLGGQVILWRGLTLVAAGGATVGVASNYQLATPTQGLHTAYVGLPGLWTLQVRTGLGWVF
jgi:hypothetical protein